jgi:class 3 adenylate cyclase
LAPERVQRRLAAILAADVVGYSGLMEAGEEGTRARLRSLHSELIYPKIASDGGRIVKTTGDDILVELPSAVNAVQNAPATQSAMTGRNEELPEEHRLVFRVVDIFERSNAEDVATNILANRIALDRVEGTRKRSKGGN